MTFLLLTLLPCSLSLREDYINVVQAWSASATYAMSLCIHHQSLERAFLIKVESSTDNKHEYYKDRLMLC